MGYGQRKQIFRGVPHAGIDFETYGLWGKLCNSWATHPSNQAFQYWFLVNYTLTYHFAFSVPKPKEDLEDCVIFGGEHYFLMSLGWTQHTLFTQRQFFHSQERPLSVAIFAVSIGLFFSVTGWIFCLRYEIMMVMKCYSQQSLSVDNTSDIVVTISSIFKSFLSFFFHLAEGKTGVNPWDGGDVTYVLLLAGASIVWCWSREAPQSKL